MSEFYFCPDESITFIRTDKKKSWCSGKLPCGRCVYNWYKMLAGFRPCIRNPMLAQFDCDNCKWKFLCLTQRFDNKSVGNMNEVFRQYELDRRGVFYG